MEAHTEDKPDITANLKDIWLERATLKSPELAAHRTALHIKMTDEYYDNSSVQILHTRTYHRTMNATAAEWLALKKTDYSSFFIYDMYSTT